MLRDRDRSHRRYEDRTPDNTHTRCADDKVSGIPRLAVLMTVGLGHAVSLLNGNTAVIQCSRHMFGTCRSRDPETFESVIFLDAAGLQFGQQIHRMGRYADEIVDTGGLDMIQQAVAPWPVMQDEFPADDEGRPKGSAAEIVTERAERKRYRICVESPGTGDTACGDELRIITVHHALWRAGRTRRKCKIGNQIGIPDWRASITGARFKDTCERLCSVIGRQLVDMSKRWQPADQVRNLIVLGIRSVARIMDIGGTGRALAHRNDLGDGMIAMGRWTADIAVTGCGQQSKHGLGPIGRTDENRIALNETAPGEVCGERVDSLDEFAP